MCRCLGKFSLIAQEGDKPEVALGALRTHVVLPVPLNVITEAGNLSQKIMPGLCCVPNCNGRGGQCFPSNTALRKQWIVAVKRGEPNWKPSKWTTVCRAHFSESDYVTVTKEKDPAKRKDLKPNTVPSVFSWKQPAPDSVKKRDQRKVKRQKVEEKMDFTHIEVGAEVEVSTKDDITSMEVHKSGSTPLVVLETASQTVSSGFSSSTDFMFNPRRFHFYAGLENYETFKTVFYCLGEAVFELNYFYDVVPEMSPENQFFLNSYEVTPS